MVATKRRRFYCYLLVAVGSFLFLSTHCITIATESCPPGDVTDDEEAENSARKPTHRHALVTLITTHAYVAGALVLAASLDKVQAAGDRVVLVVTEDERSDVTDQDLRDLELMGWTVRSAQGTECRLSPELRQLVEEQVPDMLRYWGTCHKFACWSLTEYDAVLYIDADGIAINNPDHLFEYTKHSDFRSVAAVPEPCPPEQNTPCGPGFQSALLLIKPSMQVFEYLKQFAAQNYAAEGELPLLNRVFQDTWLRLPKYTMVASTHSDRPRLLLPNESSQDVDWHQVTTYDFAGPAEYKPWRTYELQRSLKNKHAISQLGTITQTSPLFYNFLPAQWLWNDYYDKVLLKLVQREEDDGISCTNNPSADMQ